MPNFTPQNIKIASLYGIVDIDEEMASLMVNNQPF
jgi:hypothetical protein